MLTVNLNIGEFVCLEDKYNETLDFQMFYVTYRSSAMLHLWWKKNKLQLNVKVNVPTYLFYVVLNLKIFRAHAALLFHGDEFLFIKKSLKLKENWKLKHEKTYHWVNKEQAENYEMKTPGLY